LFAPNLLQAVSRLLTPALSPRGEGDTASLLPLGRRTG
jgi:hypothetical protein